MVDEGITPAGGDRVWGWVDDGGQSGVTVRKFHGGGILNRE